MNADREQPLNPPGWDAPERKIKRQYVPMREYDDIIANGYRFLCNAEIEACGIHDEDLRVAKIIVYCHKVSPGNTNIPMRFLDSYISRTGPTWRDLIEREICRQASELPGTAWEIEYEGESE